MDFRTVADGANSAVEPILVRVHKEIEVDQNTALGIVMGSFILGLAIIVAAAITG